VVDDVPVPQRDPAVGIEPLDVVHVSGEVVFDGAGDGERIRSSAYHFLANVR